MFATELTSSEAEDMDNDRESATLNQPEPIFDRFTQTEWIAAEAFTTVATLLVMWIGVSLVVYGVRTGKWKRRTGNNIADLNSGPIYSVAVAAAVFAFIHFVDNQVAFNAGYGDETSTSCEVSIDLSTATLALILVCLYLLLWLKQHYLYQHIAEVLAISKWLVAVKWATLVLLTLSGLVCCINYIIPANFSSSSKGCVAAERRYSAYWPLFLASGSMLLMEILLIFLFIFPLRFQLGGTNSGRILRILKRSAALAVTCALSHLLITVLTTLLLPRTVTRHVIIASYDVTTCVALGCTLLSFEYWREIVTCLCKRPSLTGDRHTAIV